MTTFEKLSANYSEITLQNLSEKSHEELLTMLLKIIQTGKIFESPMNTETMWQKIFGISVPDIADILRGREI
jgi:hypothetical protein